jgi:hypothetical protein
MSNDELTIVPIIDTLVRVIFDNGQIGDVKTDKPMEEVVKLVEKLISTASPDRPVFIVGRADNNAPCALAFVPTKIAGLFVGPWPKQGEIMQAQADPRVLAAIAAQEAKRRH